MDFIKEALIEFFKWNGSYQREVEGWFSWQHLLFVTLMVLCTFGLAIWLGRKYRSRTFREKKKVMKIAAILIVATDVVKYVVLTIRDGNPMVILSMLPLFLCSLIVLALPFAAWENDRFGDICTDFVFIFGIVSVIGGTYLAGNYFSGSPVISFEPVNSVTYHCIAGFASVFAMVSGLAEMKKKNLPWVCCILLVFEGIALLANTLLAETSYENNYMFLTRGAGTPFDMFMDIVGGNQILYTICVALTYFLYLGAFILIYYALTGRFKKKKETV